MGITGQDQNAIDRQGRIGKADAAGATGAPEHSRRAASMGIDGGNGEEDRDPEPERYFPNPDRPQARPS